MTRSSSPIHPAHFLLFAPAALCLWGFRRLDFLWLEALLFVLIAAAVLIAGKSLSLSARPPAIVAGLRHASRKPLFAFCLPACVSIIARVILLPWIPIPNPVVPDEFSHILLAKTFLLGRLANPAHPLWQHFESIHILSQPTYSSMYMVGQACFLAAGQFFLGNLFWGVLLSTALFCGALTWFLRAYVPPGWALFGGILAAVRIGAASYWNDSYWGGSAGALGGAMVLGAYPRLIKTWKPLPALVFAGGLALLASTRPWEGAILGATLIATLLHHILTQARRPTPWTRMAHCATIAALALGVSGWAMTREWKAVTGHPLTLPYQVNQSTYGWPLTLPWIKVRPVTYRHPEFQLYRNFEIGEHRQVTEPAAAPLGLLLKYSHTWRFFFGVTLCPTFLFTSRILKSRRTRIVWIAGATVAVAVLIEQTGYPHYWSPIAPVIFLFIVQGLRHLVQSTFLSSRFGPAIVRMILPVVCVLVAARAATMSSASPPAALPNFMSWCCVDARIKDREPLVRRLNSIQGQNLVIVHYDLKTYDTFEWVYNDPDIDGSRIVFARDMGPEKNAELIRYYSGRRIWRVIVEKDKVASLVPLNASPGSPAVSLTR